MENDRRMNDINGDTYFSPTGMAGSSPPSRLLPATSQPSTAVAVGVNGGANYIVHTVSKFDTLAGVAIKYGVEVADIKRLNGLVTDLQMFALKTLQIPLPGRHAPSPSICNGHETPQRPSTSEQAPSSRRHSDFFDTFQSLKLKSSSGQKISPAMSSLQGYYGLRQADHNPTTEGFEMAVYGKGGSDYVGAGTFSSSLPISNTPLSHQRRSKSVTNGFTSANGGLLDPLLSQEAENSSGSDQLIEKLFRRRQKSETDFTKRTPEKLLKEENNSGGGAISAITGKGLALRPKSASRTVSGGMDGEAAIPFNLNNDSSLTDTVNVVRKSSSTSSLQDSENNGALSSIWSTSKWSLKPDFQALSTAAITRPIFDGLPKPMGRRNKTALD